MKIFRGDSLIDGDFNPDPIEREERKKRIALIKKLAPHCLFPSNLANHGNPYQIVKTGLLSNSLQHTSANYNEPNFKNTTHFLSFSSDIKMAEKFGTVFGQLGANAIDSGFSVGGSDTNKILDKTDYLLIEIDITNRQPVSGNKGIYLLNYSVNKKILLINSLEFLQEHLHEVVDMNQYNTAVGFAKTESEWLVLSADVQSQGGIGQSSSAFIHTVNETINVKAYITFYPSSPWP